MFTGGAGNMNPWEFTPGGYHAAGGVVGYKYGGGGMYCMFTVGE